LIALAVIAGCGTLAGPRTGTISPPTDALARWQTFPADQVPRPIVLLGSFLSTCAKLIPAFQPSTQAPKEATASWTDGTSYSYAAISVADAIVAFGRTETGASGRDCSKVPPIAVTAARFDTVSFRTDRGGASMSAWLFSAGGVLGEIPYPAIVQSAFWGTGVHPASIGGGATVSANGRVLMYSFVGGPPDGPCAQDYTGVVAESTHAVAVGLQSSPGRVQAGPNSCDTVGRIRSVTVALARALSGRVLVDASGAAVPVCPEAIRPNC
jgi:hypothetical protein